jgi:hypothetical protein
VTSERLAMLEGLPRYPGSNPIAGPNKKAGTVAQSFEVEGVPTRSVINFYETHLPGWQQITSRQLSPRASRARFVQDHTRLTVSAGRAPTLEEDETAINRARVVQYSLVLETTAQR